MNFRDAALMQVASCENLGSAFTANLCRIFAKLPDDGGAVMARLLSWPGDASAIGDAVPLRLAGALHALVLQRKADYLADVYPPNQIPDDAALSATMMRALASEADHILHWLDSPPQTNEVRRSAAIIPAMHLLAARHRLPLVTSELGASAGLNMAWDHYGLRIGDVTLGDATAAVQLTPDWGGPVPAPAGINVAARGGCDLNPLSPVSATDRLRLTAYTWPDQPDRIARLHAALSIAEATAVKVQKADVVDWLIDRLSTPYPGHAHVIYHSIAWQYFPANVAARATALIEAAGARATADAPLAWLSIEADEGPEGAAITLQSWPGAVRETLGRMDFHGRWVRWEAE